MTELNPAAEAQIAADGDVKRRDLQQENVFKIQDLLQQCRKHWWWFLVSVILCVGAAWVYAKRQAPVYERESLVLVVRNDGSQGADVSASFQAFGLFQSNPEKRTELLALTAPSVMMEVTRRLALNVHYSTPGGWYARTLYGANQPVLVTFPGWTDESGASIELELQPGGTAVIKSIERPYEGGRQEFDDLDIKVNYVAGQTVETPAGPVSIALNPVYSGGEIKEPLTVNVRRASIYGTAMSLTSRLQGTTIDDWADVLSLKISDVSTQRAEDILNTVVSIYNEDWVRERSRVAEATSRFINDRLNIIEHELGDVDSDIAGYKSANLVPDVQATASMYVEKANKASEALLEQSNRLAMTRYVREFMTSASNSNSVLPSNTGVADVNIESQIAEYNRTLMERNSLASNSSASNPLVSDLDTRLQGMRHALVQSLDNAIASLNTSIASLQRSESASTSKIASTPTQARYLLSVERQQKVKESLYLYLLQKREENELSQNYVTSKVRVISQPLGSPNPIAPRTRSILAVGFVLGLLIPIAVIFLRETLNTRVRDRKDIEHLKVPFIGEIPLNRPHDTLVQRMRNRCDVPQGIVVAHKNLNIINEAFRVLRTNLGMIARRDSRSEQATVIAVTSALPGSGKTFVSMNLAAAEAIKGQRVLMVDLDLRRAALSEDLLGSDNSSLGIVNYLVGSASKNDVIHRWVNGIEGLDLVPVGLIPPNPSELLEDPRMKQFVDEVKKDYDYIFFDCPPIDIVADAMIVNPMVDMTLFIIRAGLFQRSMLPMVQEIYDEKRYKNLAVILNGTNEPVSGYGYSYGYTRKYYKRNKPASNIS